VLRDSDLAAVIEDGAGGAFGESAGADVLARRGSRSAEVDLRLTIPLERAKWLIEQQLGDFCWAAGGMQEM